MGDQPASTTKLIYTQKQNNIMKKVVAILAVLLMISCNKTSLGESEIGIKTRGGLPFIEIEINGNKAEFLLDTGANMSYINSKKIGDFGILINSNAPGTDLTGVGGSGGITNGVYKFSIKKNDTTELPNNINFRTTDLSNIGIKIDGIIGSDYLRKNNALIDYKTNIVIIGR